MNTQHIFSDNIGLIHFIFSMTAVITGTTALIKIKGTKAHKRIGYFYTFSMFILLVTSFMMYNLYGKFGIFHWLAVVSSVTLLGGIIPMLLKKPKSYITMHFNFMFWSVFGLYGAFAAEVIVRIPKAIVQNEVINPSFYNLVGLAVFIVMGFGYYVSGKKKNVWAKFDKSNKGG